MGQLMNSSRDDVLPGAALADQRNDHFLRGDRLNHPIKLAHRWRRHDGDKHDVGFLLHFFRLWIRG